MWCAWGYGRRFKVEQIEKTIPEAKRLGFEWVTVDDGWQTKYGDLTLNPKKFPRGDADMKALVDEIHRQGLKAQLWWSPMSAAPDSELLKEEPELVLRNKDGSPQKISWWNSLYLCPADSDVIAVQRKFVEKIIGDWGVRWAQTRRPIYEWRTSLLQPCPSSREAARFDRATAATVQSYL
jgi:alpha-galactosidase